MFTPRHRPEDTLYGNLTFARKYEGIDLAVYNSLFKTIEADQLENIISQEPTGIYSRRLWFLWEWLREEQLNLENATRGNFVPLINSNIQYIGKSRQSRRHRVNNNLPGTRNFCPLIRKTEKLEQFIGKNLQDVAIKHIGQTHPDLLGRAAAFLLLKDSLELIDILEHFSKPRLDLIEWRPTEKNNVAVLNDTIDLYRYYDATKHAEFFFECVGETVYKILPEEVLYLDKYDRLNAFIKNYIAIPDNLVDLLIRFLHQNNGKISKRPQSREFEKLTSQEMKAIEHKYAKIFY